MAWLDRYRHWPTANILGNVLTIITDFKSGISKSGTRVFEAEIVHTSDYYPFGLGMEGRNLESEGEYRYGFNGKEKEAPLTGDDSSYDFGARIYNPVLGRWFAVDFYSAKFPNHSTYGYVINNPIIYIDPDGNDVVLSETFRKLFLKSFRIFKQSDIAKKLLNTWAHKSRGDYFHYNNGNLNRHTLEFHDGGDGVTWMMGGGLTRIYVQNSEGKWELYDENTKINKNTVFKLQMNVQGGLTVDSDDKGYMAAILNHEAFLWGNVYSSWIEKWEQGGMSNERLKELFGSLAISRRYAGILNSDSDIQIAHRSTLKYLKNQVLNSKGKESKDWRNLLFDYMEAREDEIDTMGRANGGEKKANAYLETVEKEHKKIKSEIKG